MKNIISFASLFACLFVLVFACCEKNDPPSVYENCCGTVPTVDSVLLDTTGWSQFLKDTMPQYAKVYVPNIFVLSTDDDFFSLFAGQGVFKMNLTKITGDGGEVYFEEKDFLANDYSKSWKGQKPDGSMHTGHFNYEFEVQFVDGQIQKYSGQACAFQCHESGFPSEKLPDCFFPSQNNGNGGINRTTPYPKNCF